MARLRIRPGQRLLFVGDSNTDCEHNARAPKLGYGFVMMVNAMLRASHPRLDFEVLNRGNDGDTVVDLARRWDEDVLREDPDWLFVMIGTNDVGYRFVRAFWERALDDPGFEIALSELIGRRAPPRARVVLIEPPMYELPVDSEPNVALRQATTALDRVAARFDCEIVRTQDDMSAAMVQGRTGGWFQNMNHPDFPGHAFLAQRVLRLLGWSFP